MLLGCSPSLHHYLFLFSSDASPVITLYSCYSLSLHVSLSLHLSLHFCPSFYKGLVPTHSLALSFPAFPLSFSAVSAFLPAFLSCSFTHSLTHALSLSPSLSVHPHHLHGSLVPGWWSRAAEQHIPRLLLLPESPSSQPGRY